MVCSIFDPKHQIQPIEPIAHRPDGAENWRCYTAIIRCGPHGKYAQSEVWAPNCKDASLTARMGLANFPGDLIGVVEDSSSFDIINGVLVERDPSIFWEWERITGQHKPIQSPLCRTVLPGRPSAELDPDEEGSRRIW